MLVLVLAVVAVDLPSIGKNTQSKIILLVKWPLTAADTEATMALIIRGIIVKTPISNLITATSKNNTTQQEELRPVHIAGDS